MTSRGGAGGAGRARSTRSASRTLWLACAVVVGVSVGRVVFVAPTEPDFAPAAPANPTESVAALEQRVQQQPGNADALAMLGVAYVRKAAQTGDPSFYDLAQSALDRADAAEPGLEETAIGRGVLALSRHQFAEALDLAGGAHTRNPDDPDALAVMIDGLVELGRYDEAGAAIQELLDRRPGLPAYSRLSYLRELEGDTPGALRAMHLAEIAASGSAYDRATVAAFLGDLELGRGRLGAASQEYRRALRLQPDLALANLGAARVAAAQGDRPAAIRRLRRLTARIPLPAALTVLGDLESLQGDDRAATTADDTVRTIAKLQRAAGQVTDLETALFEADHAGDAAGAAAAVDAARRAYDARPDNIYVADALAWSLSKAGDPAAARPLVDQALRLGTSDSLLHFHAAVVTEAVGEFDRARAEITKVFSGSPAFSFSQRQTAVDLAARLGVAIPVGGR